MDEYQIKANSLFEDGEYEEAISTMAQSASISAEDFKNFVARCNSFMTEQYKVLIEQAINDDDYNELIALHEAYRKRFGENKEIEGLFSDGLKRIKVPSLHGCPICGEMIDDGLETCPICHERIKENKQNLRADTSISHFLIANKKVLTMISLVILMATIIFILIENKDSNVGSPMHYDNQEEWYMDTVPAPTDTVSVDDYYEY